MFTLKQTSVIIALIIIASNIAQAQTSTQNFGTGTGSFTTANSSSTSFLPNPTGSGSTYVAINNGGGSINLQNPGLSILGTGTEVRASASSNTSVSKFAPILSYTNATSYYTTFWMVLGNSSGGTSVTSGDWSFYQGAGTQYNAAGDMATNQVHAGLRFTFGSGGSISTEYLNNSSWNSLSNANISQGNLYKVEIMGNNSNSTINYNYGNSSNSVAKNKFDLWINGVLVGNDLAKGGIANTNNINSTNFIGKSSASNAANIFIDDINIYNSIPNNISTSCSAPTTATSNLTFSSVNTTSMNLSWTNGDGSNRIIIARRDNPVSASASNNTTYTGNTAFGSGTQISSGEYVVYNGYGSSATITSLQSGYMYYFKIIEYNCSDGNEQYYNAGATTDSKATIPASVSSFQNICVGNGNIILNWNTPASGYEGILIFARISNPSFNPSGNNGSSYAADSDFSTASIYGTDRCVYNGTGNSVTISGLNSGTTYYFRAYAYTGDSYSPVTATINALSGMPEVSGASVTTSSGTLDVNWTNPITCFDEIMAVAVSINNVTAVPDSDGTQYFDDSFFGTDIANSNMPSDEYVVYKGTGNSLSIFGLINGTNYKVKIYTRIGTTWSSGVQVNGTPTNVSGDYRSKTSGNWTSTSTWERFNGSVWVAAATAPNNKTASITIQSGHTVTFDNGANGFSVKNLIVESGAKIYANSTSQQRFLNIFTQINNDGTIGNGNTKDGFAVNIEGGNVSIGGTGSTTLSRIRKSSNTNTTTNCNISSDINLMVIGSNTALIYNNQGNSTFNLSINNSATVSTPSNSGDISIDGVDGTAGGGRRGSITVSGTLYVGGTLYATTSNGTGASNQITIMSSGIINVNEIEASASSNGGHIFTIKNNGWLNIFGTGFSSFSKTKNTYDFQPGSLVEYSKNGAQTVESRIDYANLKYSGSDNKTQNNDLTVNGNLIVDAAIYNAGGSSRNLNLGGNFTMQNGGMMAITNCRDNLTIICNNNNAQLFNGNGQEFECYVFTSTKSAGSITLSSNSKLYSKDDMILDYTGNSVFNDGGNTITIGAALRFGSASSSASNFNFTGTILFNFDITTNGDSYITNVAKNNITVAELNNVTLMSVSNATLPQVEIYPTSGGQTLTIKGNVSINNVNFNAILITNNNNIIVKGNWSTYSQVGLTEGTGRVTFGGTSNQSITGEETFYQMEINNPTSVTLNDNIIVSNALRLNVGVIITGVKEVRVTNNSASNAVVLQNNNSYVRGNLRRTVASTGTYDFPVGNADYQLATVKLNSSSGISTIVASFTSGLPGTMPNPTTCKVNGTGIANMLNNGYWTITPNAVTTVNYDITLKGRGYSNFSGGATQIGVIKRSNGSSPWLGTNSSGIYGYHNAGNQNISNGTASAKRTNVTSFSDFGIGFGANPLPVQMTAFDVVPNSDQTVLVKWSTASELNCDYFEIEHSINGIDFTVIGKVKGAGTSEFANNYSFIHQTPSCGVNYYRLRQVDFDLKFEFSAIKYVQFNCNSTVTLYPNPATNIIYISSKNIQEGSIIRIMNIDGRVLMQTNYTSSGIDVKSLTSGLYLVELESGNNIIQTRFIKSE